MWKEFCNLTKIQDQENGIQCGDSRQQFLWLPKLSHLLLIIIIVYHGNTVSLFVADLCNTVLATDSRIANSKQNCFPSSFFFLGGGVGGWRRSSNISNN